MPRSRGASIALVVAGSVLASCTSDASEGPASAPTLTDNMAMAWSGDEVLVVGGDFAGPAGTQIELFDPASERWSAVAHPPFEHPLFSPVVYWVGDAFLVLGVSCASYQPGSVSLDCTPGTLESALYDPAADSWAAAGEVPIDLPRETELIGSSSSADRSILRIGLHVYVFDNADRSWAELDVPFGRGRTECLVGDDLLVIGGDLGPPAPQARAYSFATGEWSETVTLGLTAPTWTFACGPEGAWAIAGGASLAATFTAANRFEVQAAPPDVGGIARADRAGDSLLVRGPGPRGWLALHDGTWTLVADQGEVRASLLVGPRTAVVMRQSAVDPSTYELSTLSLATPTSPTGV